MIRLPHLHPGEWPVAVKVPLLVACLMAMVGTAISYTVLARLVADQEVQLRQLAAAYLGSLAVAVEPHLARQDVWETFDVLDHAHHAASIAAARLLVVTLPDGSVVAASDPLTYPVGTMLPAPLLEQRGATADLVIDEARGLAWSHQPVGSHGPPLGHILAEMDIARLITVRREVLATLIAVNGGLTLLLAVVGYALVRRLLRPVAILSEHVERGRNGAVEPIAEDYIARQGGEFGRLFQRFNAMALAMAERGTLAARLADEEKLALLGRLASGMAHEVNNPLGGLLTAVDTVKRHGADDAVRQRSAALLERGLHNIGHVVRAALVAYKAPAGGEDLTAADIDDLQFLIAHEAQRRRLHLTWDNRLAGTVAVDGTAVRQMVLNLLLNACRVSSPGATVTLSAQADENALTVTIGDQGPGLPDEMAAVLQSHGAAPLPQGGRGLGLWTVSRLLHHVNGQVDISVTPGGGAAVTLSMPLSDRPVSERSYRHAAA